MVVRVVDGDTVDVLLEDSRRERLRLIGMDTPELYDPRKPVQCFAREASARAHELLDGQRVSIEGDPSQDTRDRYGRLLAYLWLDDATLFNLRMIAEGYAHEYTYHLPYRYQAEFKEAERQAREQQRGLWSPGTCDGDTTQPAASTAPQATSSDGADVGEGSSPDEPTPSTAGPSPQQYSTENPAPGVARGDPSWPCAPGQIKGNRNSGIYHVPSGDFYARTYANVICFDTEGQAQAAGFRRSLR